MKLYAFTDVIRIKSSNRRHQRDSYRALLITNPFDDDELEILFILHTHHKDHFASDSKDMSLGEMTLVSTKR